MIPRIRESRAWTLPIALALAIQGLYLAFGLSPLRIGELLGPDSYMRFVRIAEFTTNWDWFDRVIERSNAPFGEILHWTRLFDAMVVLGAAPLAPFLGWEEAVYYAGALSGPVLQVVVILLLYLAAREVLSPLFAAVTGIAFLVQAGPVYGFMMGRMDHHSLMQAVFAAVLYLAFVLAREAPNPRHATALGVTLALGNWVSVESLVIAALALGWLGVRWLMGDRRAAPLSRRSSLALAAGAAVALLIDPPSADLLAPIYDRLSIAHVVLFALIALFWQLPWTRTSEAAARARWLVGAAGIVALAAIMAAVFPNFLAGPYADVDPKVIEIYLERVNEVRPLMATLGDHPVRAVLGWTGVALACLPIMIFWSTAKGGPEEKSRWRFLLAALLLYGALAFYQVRWVPYVGLLVAIPLGGVMAFVFGLMERRYSRLTLAIVRPLFIVLFCLGLFLFAARNLSAGRPPVADGGGKLVLKCPITLMARHLRGDPELARGHRILANTFDGPMLLYRSRHEVIATPYHRNAQGILAAHAMLSETSAAVAERLIRERGVDMVLVCSDATQLDTYRGSDDALSLHHRLLNGEQFAWLKRIELPLHLSNYGLFEVAPTAPGSD